MARRRTLLLFALGGVALAVGGLGLSFWSNSRVRVQSAEQAVEMAKAAYGRPDEPLPIRVEADQDLWIVRMGPDRRGQMHNYLVTIWDKRAGELIDEQTVVVDLKKPERRR